MSSEGNSTIFVSIVQRTGIFYSFETATFRFDDMYNLTVAVQDQKGKWHEATVAKSVANFFDENGVLVSDAFEKEVRKLHDSLTREKKRK